MGVHSSVLLGDDEHRLLLELAAEHNTAKNAIIRVALRDLLGLPNPRWVKELREANIARREAAA